MSNPTFETSMAIGAPSTRTEGVPVGIAVGPWTGIAVGLLLACAVGWAFSEFLLSNVRWAIGHPADWGHLLVIPLISGWLVWSDRERLQTVPFRTTWFGLVPLGLGLAWYAMCVAGSPVLWHHNLRAIGFGLALFGLAILFCGWRAMGILWFPLAYMVLFGQHISVQLLSKLTEPLQDIAARGGWLVLNALTIDTDRSGNLLTVWHSGTPHNLNIAEACSGMRMVVAFLAVGVAIAYTGLPRLWQQIVLVALAVPVALVVNILRVVTLGVLSLWDMDLVMGEFHTLVGMLWFIPGFIAYLGIVWLLRNIIVDHKEAPSPSA